MSTAHQALITLTVDGQPLGVFDTRSGGATTAEITKHRPGGSPRQKSYGGRKETEDVTVTRVYERERDADLVRTLRERVGRADAVVGEQLLDEDDVPFGTPTTWGGKLMSVNVTDADSDSDEVRFLEIGVSATEVS